MARGGIVFARDRVFIRNSNCINYHVNSDVNSEVNSDYDKNVQNNFKKY